MNNFGKILLIAFVILGLVLASMLLGKAWAEEEEYPSNMGPPEVIFACKPVPTKLAGVVYNCTECPDFVGKRTFNTCTGEKKWLN